MFVPAWVADGVTGVRHISTELADHARKGRWAATRDAGIPVAPRMVRGSPLLSDVPPIQPNGLPVASADVARRVVNALVDGRVALDEALNVVEGYDLSAMRRDSPQYVHRVVESLRRALVVTRARADPVRPGGYDVGSSGLRERRAVASMRPAGDYAGRSP